MPPRYRFADFTVSVSRRTLARAGREVPLIPRYFDLLVLLIDRRREAVSRQQILDAVWSDVVVSDGALSQAVRTLRRALGDTAREPSFIRTMSRHGYRFVRPDVVEEDDDVATRPGPEETSPGGSRTPSLADGGARPAAAQAEDPFEPALLRLLGEGEPGGDDLDDGRREAAETLHVLGTAETLRRLDRRAGHARARALLRDARWDVPGAGPVPLLGQPGSAAAIVALVFLRLRQAARLARGRWGAASGGGALAGILAGLLGGALLRAGDGDASPASLPLSLALVGAVAGGLWAAGIGAGLAFAEAIARSFRGVALVACGALAGMATGGVAQLLVRSLLAGLFGQDVSSIGGGFEGLMLGAAAGFGYAVSTPRPAGGGMATPRGPARLGAALSSGVLCALAGVVLCRLGGHLVGTSLNLLAHAYQGSHVGLAPLARLLGESTPGPLTSTLSCALEGMFFGTGLVMGLTRRPR